MLCYKTYLLNDCDESESSRVNKNGYSTIERVGTTRSSSNLDGLEPLSILTFLARFKLQAKNNDASERMLKLVLPTLSKGNAPIA